MEKQCSSCRTKLVLARFKNQSSSPDGRADRCRSCEVKIGSNPTKAYMKASKAQQERNHWLTIKWLA